MTFCSEEQNKSEIITKVDHNNNFYTLHYLDGTRSSFYNNDKNYLIKLEEKLIEQAKEREKTDYTSININKWGSLIVSLASINLTNLGLKKELFSIACIGFILTLFLISNYRKNSKRLKELKKYKILLENYNEFKNSPNLSKLIEFEAIYREPVNIFTIDKFNLNEIKLMQKVLKDKEC